MVVSLSGCFDKEGDQRKAFIDSCKIRRCVAVNVCPL
ncbi:DUF3053 family protein [Kosakonia radicincitans]